MARVLPDFSVHRVDALPTPASSYTGQFRRTTTGLYFSDGAQWLLLDGTSNVDPWDYITLPSNVAVSTTTFGVVTGMAFPAVANTVYEVEVFGTFQSAANTTGIALALDIPSGTVTGMGSNSTSATAVGGFEQIADGTTTGATTGVRAAATNAPIWARYLVSVGATPGNVQLMMRSEIAASAVTLQGGRTILKYRKARNETQGIRFLPITQAAYDALASKDANTLYVIVSAPVTGYSYKWVAVSAAEYAAIGTKDPETLYVVTD